MTQLKALYRGLIVRRAGAFVGRSLPKLAVLSGAAMVVIGGWAPPLNLALMARGVLLVVLAAGIDLLWSGRDFKSVILGRSHADLRSLIARIPIEWEVGCRSKHPDLVAAEILEMIEDRLERLGETTIKDA